MTVVNYCTAIVTVSKENRSNISFSASTGLIPENIYLALLLSLVSSQITFAYQNITTRFTFACRLQNTLFLHNNEAGSVEHQCHEIR